MLKLPSSLFKKDPQSWAVILRAAPDKESQEALARIFTEKLNLALDDAQKIVQSSPIVLFEKRGSREAEQIKLCLNETGVRTAISNDTEEFKRLPRVVWPKKVELKDFGPKAPQPITATSAPKPPSTEWETKYKTLQQSYLEIIARLEKKETELVTLQDKLKQMERESLSSPKLAELGAQLKVLSQENEKLTRERDEAKTKRQGASLKTELEKIKNQLEKILENLK